MKNEIEMKIEIEIEAETERNWANSVSKLSRSVSKDIARHLGLDFQMKFGSSANLFGFLSSRMVPLNLEGTVSRDF